jgi:hypothetical protein
MLNDLETVSIAYSSSNAVPILDRKSVKTCHIVLPDMPQAVGAIAYNNRFYSYVRFYPTLEAAKRASERMLKHGNKVILTRIPKGLVLWVFEPDARLAR